VFYYCLEACPLKKSQRNAVDFASNCAFRKIFSMRSHEVGEMCKLVFSCQRHPMQWQTEIYEKVSGLPWI